MADNTTLNSGSGGDVIRTDDISGVKYPVSKIALGADGTVDGLVSTATPLPVSDAGGSLTVDGPLTDAQLRASAVPVSGTFYQATQPISGTVTANAGTNLNTSTLALEAGGNLAAVAASLATLDNIVAGNEAQVDVITLPSLPAGSNNIGTVELSATALAALETITVATVTAPLAAGDNNIGDVDIASIAAGDNNIGNVDIVSLPNVTLNALPAGTNNIGDVDVLTLPALPAGTNNIGDVDILSIAAGDNNIGNVDVVTLPALPAGTNNIGDVDVLTLPATPAGTNLIGSVNAQLDASTMRDGAGTALTPKFAAIDAASSGDNTLLAAVASKKIRVLSVFLVAAGAVNVRFESGASGTALTGQMNLAANGGFVLPFNPVGWFETASNTLLNLELSGAVSVDGSFAYVEV